MADTDDTGTPPTVDLVQSLGIADLEAALLRLTRGKHRIGISQRDIDDIHDGLLKKKRQTGDLRLTS